MVDAAEGDEELLSIAGAVVVALRAGVGLPLLLNAVLAQRAQSCVTPEVKEATKVAAQSEAGLALVEDGGDAAFVKGEEEGEAAGTVADPRDVELNEPTS